MGHCLAVLLRHIKGIYAMSNKLLQCISKNVWMILAKLAQDKNTISFNDLKNKTGLNEYHLGLVIRSIALRCLKQNLPILSSIIDNPTAEEYLIRPPWSRRQNALHDVYEFNWNIISNPFTFAGIRKTLN